MANQKQIGTRLTGSGNNFLMCDIRNAGRWRDENSDPSLHSEFSLLCDSCIPLNTSSSFKLGSAIGTDLRVEWHRVHMRGALLNPLQYQRPGLTILTSIQDAIGDLNTLQSNAATIAAMRATGGGQKADLAISEMVEYMDRIGYSTEDLNRLNVVHVTGTKGKGSTCAFTDSILRRMKPHWKIGLYTSPHLVSTCERIKIDGKPISERLFAQYFYHVWDSLGESKSEKVIPPGTRPMYFKFMTLVAFHAFMSLKVDATILEVGVGGMYDSTNIVPKPLVTGVTALGLDHTLVLGKTLKEIGWQKGGIYKPGVPALSVPQVEEGRLALERQATDRKASEFRIVPPLAELSNIKLGLSGSHQISNASLAVELARIALSAHPSDPTCLDCKAKDASNLSPAFIEALQTANWPGRCQTVVDPSRSDSRWFLDGAHTVESLSACAQWYISPGVALPETVSSEADLDRSKRVLIFNCTGGRLGQSFVETLQSTFLAQLESLNVADYLRRRPGFFNTVIFCTNVTYADGHFKGDLTTVAMSDEEKTALTPQRQLAAAWTALVPDFDQNAIHVLPSIEHALRIVRDQERTLGAGEDLQVLVSGSLHLVGGVIEVAGLKDVAL